MTVTVAMNNQVTTDEAAKTLGCSYSHLMNLVRERKIKAQKKNNVWLVDATDLSRAKSTHLVKPRPHKSVKPPEPIDPNSVEIKIVLPRDKFELVKLVLKNSDKSLVQILTQRFDSIYDQVQEKLSSVAL